MPRHQVSVFITALPSTAPSTSDEEESLPKLTLTWDHHDSADAENIPGYLITNVFYPNPAISEEDRRHAVQTRMTRHLVDITERGWFKPEGTRPSDGDLGEWTKAQLLETMGAPKQEDVNIAKEDQLGTLLSYRSELFKNRQETWHTGLWNRDTVIGSRHLTPKMSKFLNENRDVLDVSAVSSNRKRLFDATHPYDDRALQTFLRETEKKFAGSMRPIVLQALTKGLSNDEGPWVRKWPISHADNFKDFETDPTRWAKDLSSFCQGEGKVEGEIVKVPIQYRLNLYEALEEATAKILQMTSELRTAATNA